MAEPANLAEAAAEALSALRARRPRVHVITNSVAQPLTANLLLAVGATPSMTVAPEEVPDFTARADALAVNLGTLDAMRRSAIPAALDVATEEGRPWVLDPVFVEASPPRLDFARDLLQREPWVLRGNRDEIAVLAGAQTYQPEIAARVALEALTTVAVTGENDLVTDGSRQASVGNGHPLLAALSGSGCAGSALTAAFLAVTADRFVAAVAGLATIGLAAESAAVAARGPGSFAWRLIDAIHELSPGEIARRARID